MRNVTLNDVAEYSGVSYQTVSRVINKHPNVAERTRERVLEAIRILDYRPNQAARSLVTNRSNAIAIISFGTTLYGPSQMVSNITTYAKQNGFSVTLSTVEDLTYDQIKLALDDIQGQLIAGIVMIAPVFSRDMARVKELVGNIPFVQIDTAPQPGVASVIIEQAHGAALATRHLIELGHRRIAEISGPMDWYGAILRHSSWQQTLQAHQLSGDLWIEGDWSAASGYACTRQLLEQGSSFTGLVVANDQMALGAIAALQQAGLRVPHDVSVVGFDNIPEAAFFAPPLTTVNQDFIGLGEQSIEYLVSLIRNPKMPVHQRVLYPELVIRQSTGALG